jgi:hypothetical protein
MTDMTPVSPETMAREYAASKWSGPENGHLKVYTQNDFRAGYQAGHSAALAAPLTEEEATAVGRVVGDASNRWMSSIVHGEEHLIVQVAFNALVQLRTQGEKK